MADEGHLLYAVSISTNGKKSTKKAGKNGKTIWQKQWRRR